MSEQPNERITIKIQALLERAQHPATGDEERQACMEKADALMAKYRIDRAMLNFDRKDTIREIISREMDRNLSEYSAYLNSMMFRVYEHCGCKVASGYGKYTAVGYEEDIFFGDMLWATIQLEFARKMMPTWEASRPFDQNVFLLKESGKSWMEIVHMAPASERLNRNSGGRLRGAYKRWADRIGYAVPKEQPRQPKLWRESFAESFRVRLSERLWELSQKSKQDVGEQGALAIIKDEDRVLQEFYRLFPNLDPENIRKRNAEYEEAERKRREALTEEQRRKEDAENARWARRAARQPRTRAADMSGWRAGHEAASKIDLSGSSNRVGPNATKGIQ